MPLDIGIGILAAIGVAKFFSLPIEYVFIAWGVAFALLPDIDFLWVIFRNGHRNHSAIAKHRDLIHYPLLYIPAGLLLTLPFGVEWALLFLLASLGHFMHDSIGIGWGIPWLWPFTHRNYSFLYRYAAPGKSLPRRLLYRWERHDIDKLNEEYGDANWLKNIYFRLHPFFVAELLGFAVALAALWQTTATATIERPLAQPFVPEAKAERNAVN